jgi:hypothetical protein
MAERHPEVYEALYLAQSSVALRPPKLRKQKSRHANKDESEHKDAGDGDDDGDDGEDEDDDDNEYLGPNGAPVNNDMGGITLGTEEGILDWVNGLIGKDVEEMLEIKHKKRRRDGDSEEDDDDAGVNQTGDGDVSRVDLSTFDVLNSSVELQESQHGGEDAMDVDDD